MQCVMAMFSQLHKCNIMHYIKEKYVMPITFQLLLHYDEKSLCVSSRKCVIK